MKSESMKMIGKWTAAASAVLLAFAVAGGCVEKQKQDRGFFTSGNRDADQRAEQRIARDEQLKGNNSNGTGAGGSAAKDGKDTKGASPEGGKDGKPDAKQTLYERLGGEQGIAKLVDDFVTRAMADPRVNWERKGVTRGGLSLKRNESVEWKHDDAKVAEMKKHIAQFLTLATGGPVDYDGEKMKQAHDGLHITNPEFDASVGDLKMSLDKLGVAVQEQKELLAIIESTRPQISEQR